MKAKLFIVIKVAIIIYKQKYKDIKIGDVFTYLTVIEAMGRNEKDHRLYYKCKCKCGNETIVRRENLNNGNSKSCGCYGDEKTSKASRKDWTGFVAPNGIKFLSPALIQGKKHATHVLWNCECFCGNEFIVLPAKIMSGHTKSCGCLKNSSLEDEIKLYLSSAGYEILSETKCNLHPIYEGKKLRYDIEIPSIKLIIEIMGQQHYDINNYYNVKRAKQENMSVEDVFIYLQKIDQFKKDYALSHGYNYLAIPYWEFDKNFTFENTIIETINNIANTEVT